MGICFHMGVMQMNKRIDALLDKLKAKTAGKAMVDKLQAVEQFCTVDCASLPDSAIYEYIRVGVAVSLGLSDSAAKDVIRTVKTHRGDKAKAEAKAIRDENKAKAEAAKARAKAEAAAKKAEARTKANAAKAMAAGEKLKMVELLHATTPIYYDGIKLYWAWDAIDKIYKMVDEVTVLLMLKELTGEYVTDPKERNEILSLIQQMGRERGIVPPKSNVIVFKEGAVNIETGETFEPKPDVFYTSCIPHKLGTCEDTPIIDKLFEDWVGDKAITLLENLAYLMYDGYPIHIVQAFPGSGSNGKGVYSKLIGAFAGSDNVVATGLELLANSRFETAKLYKKKVALISETDSNTLNKTAMFKALSAGDRVPGEFKGVNGFSFENTAKLIMTSNALPKTNDRTDGFYRRVLVTPFCNKFKGGVDIMATIPEEEYENMLYKCIRVLRELLARGHFTLQGTVEEQKAMYELYSDPVGAFIAQKCTITDTATVPVWYLRNLYYLFAAANGYPEMRDKEFRASLKFDYGYTIAPRHYTIEEINAYQKRTATKGTAWHTVDGLGLKEIAPI